jgi:hypothetical protein
VLLPIQSFGFAVEAPLGVGFEQAVAVELDVVVPQEFEASVVLDVTIVLVCVLVYPYRQSFLRLPFQDLVQRSLRL